MATIINTPGNDSQKDSMGTTGWVVAVLILLVVIVAGAYIWSNSQTTPTTTAPATTYNSTTTNSTTDVNVTIPATTTTP